MDLPSKSDVQSKLNAIEAFMKTGAFSSYVKTMSADLRGVEESILLCPPDTEENRAAVLKLFGRREELLRNVTFFEDTQATLKQLLVEIDDAATKEPDNK